jgi:hypothetical protein
MKPDTLLLRPDTSIEQLNKANRNRTTLITLDIVVGGAIHTNSSAALPSMQYFFLRKSETFPAHFD